jgi:hypothetical protein
MWLLIDIGFAKTSNPVVDLVDFSQLDLAECIVVEMPGGKGVYEQFVSRRCKWLVKQTSVCVLYVYKMNELSLRKCGPVAGDISAFLSHPR